MRKLKIIKRVTLRYKVKSVDIMMEVGVNSITNKVRDEATLEWTNAENGRKQRSESSC